MFMLRFGLALCLAANVSDGVTGLPMSEVGFLFWLWNCPSSGDVCCGKTTPTSNPRICAEW